MNVKKLYPSQHKDFSFTLKWYRGMNRYKRNHKRSIRSIMGWAWFEADQARLHKMFSNDPYEFTPYRNWQK